MPIADRALKEFIPGERRRGASIDDHRGNVGHRQAGAGRYRNYAVPPDSCIDGTQSAVGGNAAM